MMLVEETEKLNEEYKHFIPEAETIKSEKGTTKTSWLKKYHRPDCKNDRPLRMSFARMGLITLSS